MILVRNCPHNNGIYTLIDNDEGIAIKSSYTAEGILRLTREYAGYQWYLQREKFLDSSGLCLVMHVNGLYCKLYINLFSGRDVACYKNLSYNHSDLLNAIDVYTKVWPRQKGQLAPIHGDFSLGNLIICGDETTIIDWEHFHQDAAPWGFDLVNLLYESAFFSFKGKNILNRSDRQVFVKLHRTVSALLAHEEGFNCTLQNLTQFVSNNVSFWGDLVNKLPVMKFTTSQKEYLMQLEELECSVNRHSASTAFIPH